MNRGQQSRHKVDGPRIRDIRDRAGITLSRLARDLGTDPTHLSRIERGLGQPGIALRNRIAVALGVTVEAIMDNSRRDAA